MKRVTWYLPRETVGSSSAAAADPGFPAVRDVAVGDAHEVHRDLDVAPLIEQRRIVDVHAGRRAADREVPLAVDLVRRAAVIRIEPRVHRILPRERARVGVPARGPLLAAGERGVQALDAELVD